MHHFTPPPAMYEGSNFSTSSPTLVNIHPLFFHLLQTFTVFHYCYIVPIFLPTEKHLNSFSLVQIVDL